MPDDTLFSLLLVMVLLNRNMIGFFAVCTLCCLAPAKPNDMGDGNDNGGGVGGPIRGGGNYGGGGHDRGRPSPYSR